MKINSLKLVCFSPTGTTKKVVKEIAEGIGLKNLELIDITKPKARKQYAPFHNSDLLIIGVPVYMGRVPLLVSEWLLEQKAQNTPAICVAVYGNRAYENSLIELRDLATQIECRVIGGAAFIGEHSFHSSELPAASEGRPDAVDLVKAQAFGKKIFQKIQSADSLNQIPLTKVPGEHPYGGTIKLWDVDFISVNNSCTQCGICSENCPMGAITPEDSSEIDTAKCTLCCACIKHCPQNARSMKPGPLMDAAHRVHTLFQDRKEPEFFI